ncbi:MAG: hypothetical protein ACR2HO_00175 [Rubrobacteraceae bacterium]|nr:hypothetical protein [Rubrobacter sp.]MBA3426917.1 hypothetical protein [Rubrobacter sp.]MBA3640164.1 hypothetical protein [Acidobacteriota bacterium]
MGWFSAVIEQRKFRVWALAAVLVVTMAALAGGIATGTTTTCSNPATLSGSAFEIDNDANLVVNTPSCIDWLTGGTGTSMRDGVLAKNDKPTGTGDDSFGQGTAENNPNPTIVTGSIPPNKSDLKAFGVFTEDEFLELFWSRVQNPSGTTNMDFELNQNFCDGTATLCANNGTARKPVYVTPKRTSGDKLITYDLSQGGTHPGISIRTWTGSAWGPAVVISTGGSNADALGSINTSLIPATDTGGTTGGLTTALGSQDPYTFGEAAISFDALFGEGACGTFGSAYLKSRSSDAFTSEIKDFVAPEQVNISNCSALTTDATDSVTIGSSISDTATLSGVRTNAGGTITFKAYGPNDADCSGPVAYTNTVNVNNTDGDSNGDYGSGSFTPTASGTYRWTADYSGDGNNESASSPCNAPDESSVVNKAPATIDTAQELFPQDSATLSATADGTPTGDVDFALYGPNDATCSGTPVYTQNNVALTNGTANTDNTDLSVDQASSGNYKWVVEYSGDDTHNTATSACGKEAFTATIDNDTTN